MQVVENTDYWYGNEEYALIFLTQINISILKNLSQQLSVK